MIELAPFRGEGTRRECHRVGELWWSSCTMGLLEHEWRARHSAQEPVAEQPTRLDSSG